MPTTRPGTGASDGDALADAEGLDDGDDDGDALGELDGLLDGDADGLLLGLLLGELEGESLGDDDGDELGELLGLPAASGTSISMPVIIIERAEPTDSHVPTRRILKSL